MVIFDQLRISDDGKRMYINAHVNKASYFDDVYIDSITITTGDRVMETSLNPPTTDYLYYEQFGGNQKEIGLVLTSSDFMKRWKESIQDKKFPQAEMSKTLFFVYIKCKGAPDSCTPCALDEEYTIGVTFDENMLYQAVMGYTKALGDDCSVPQGFADFILLWNAFKASVETEHWIMAIKYFNLLFGSGVVTLTQSGGCGCRH